MRNRKSAGSATRRRSGTSVLELVFAIQALLFISFGMVEFGQFFYIRHAFDAAVRDGARVAILPTSTLAQVQNTIGKTLSQANINNYSTNYTSWLTQSQSPDGINFTTTNDCTQAPAGYLISLNLSTTYSQIPNAVRPLSAITGVGVGGNKVLLAQATMVKE